MNQRRLRNENTQLQHKIAEYLSHKKVGIYTCTCTASHHCVYTTHDVAIS